VVVPAEVEDTVHRRLGDVGGPWRANDNVPELPRAADLRARVDREGEDVGWPVAPPVLAIQLADPFLADELDR
jgi:hypothetical protein